MGPAASDGSRSDGVEWDGSRSDVVGSGAEAPESSAPPSEMAAGITVVASESCDRESAAP